MKQCLEEGGSGPPTHFHTQLCPLRTPASCLQHSSCPFIEHLYEKNFPLDGQTRQAKRPFTQYPALPITAMSSPLCDAFSTSAVLLAQKKMLYKKCICLFQNKDNMVRTFNSIAGFKPEDELATFTPLQDYNNYYFILLFNVWAINVPQDQNYSVVFEVH